MDWKNVLREHVLKKEMSKYISSRLLVDNFGQISGVEIELVP